MTDADLTITPLTVPGSLDDTDAADFIAFGDLSRLVCDEEVGLPDLSPTASQMLASWQDESDSLHLGFVARRDGDIVGMVSLSYAQEEHAKAAEFDVLVPAAHADEGIAQALLLCAEDDARRRGRDVMQTWTLHRPANTSDVLIPKTGWGRIPPTALSNFLEAHGYGLEQVERNSELDLHADPGVWERALADASAFAGPDYRSLTWELPTPPALRAGYASVLARLVTDAPSGDMEFDAEVWDADRVARRDVRMTSAGQLVAVSAVEHVPTGEIVAYNELLVGPDRAGMTHQFGTLVATEHRGHRLGTIVKCANILRWRELVPQSSRVSTFNAEENRPMLDINEALGFVPVSYAGAWQKRI
ncbi:GNAT family N-acetyltransferase [Microbacterium saperdae]|uniref:Acetyltransferase (GNAT) family protein n=1 Tax=Microbacterium saperdae TaxID=69368 RepID=A0A543BNC3_9MICO|nr:GNAT family N-acetyltransferase [Microbacterium saperdae]TQL86322.1 acetyltransferase (GNAT) family protein [Microbacterium saperdae]GGM48872.1 GNAT family N-acetyltransferase [Microbacterium saperdae]